MNIPTGLLYTKDHEWIKIDGATATIGITDFAQSELGDIVYIDITTVGKEVNEHQVFGVSDLFMPITGKVLEFNTKLDTSPEKVNADPYGEGWMVKVEVKGPTSGLLTADQYKELIGK